MSNDASLSGASCHPPQDFLCEAINNAVLSLPHGRELAQLQVSFERSVAVVSSGNILPFRRNQLTEEERRELLKALSK